MGTLYDLLGALPGDDADGLRAAFRRAAKATHPDIHPDEPDAGRRFRELVHAYDILTDADQRTTYDQLLTIALEPPAPAPRSTGVYEKVRKLASSTMAATIISGVLIAGYTLFGIFSNRPGAAEMLPRHAIGGQVALAALPETNIEPPRAAVAAEVDEGAQPNNPPAPRSQVFAASYLDRDIILYRAPKFARAFDAMDQARQAARPKLPAARKPPAVRMSTVSAIQGKIPLPPRLPMIASITP